MYWRLLNNYTIVSITLWIVLRDMTVWHKLAEGRRMQRKHRTLIVEERISWIVREEGSLYSTSWTEDIGDLRSVLWVVEDWCRSGEYRLDWDWGR